MTDLKLVVDEEANNSLEPIANRKMTCDTVLGSMGGNDGSSNGQQSQQHAYDGGSLSTIEDDSPPSHRYKRKVTMMPGFCYSYFGKIAKSCTKLLPVHCSSTEQSTSSTTRSVYNLIPTTTAFRALMRRNMIYRKRNWLSGLFEMFLPTLFLILLVFVKKSYDNSTILGVKIPGGGFLRKGDSFIPQPHQSYQPMTFADVVTVLQAQKVCKLVNTTKNGVDESHFEITGIHDRSSNWQIPYVRCNSNLCTHHAQDASTFCEYSLLALSASNKEGYERATQFANWIYQRYPALNSTDERKRIVQLVEYKEDKIDSTSYPTQYGKTIDQYVTSDNYGKTPELRKISMAVVFNGSDPNIYSYAIRQNQTNFNIPEQQDSLKPGSKTSPKTKHWYAENTYQSDLESCSQLSATNGVNSGNLGVLGTSCTGQYMYNGVLAAQRLIHDFILYDTGSAENGYSVSEAGVQFVQFPQEAYDPAGYFNNNVTTSVLLGLGLLFSVASMISYIVQEKELRQKELLKMMSVTEFDIEFSWLITFMMFNTLTACFCTLVSSFLFPYSNPLLLWMFWMMTFIAITMFSTALAASSSKTTRGILVGLLVFFTGLFLSLIFPMKDFSATVIHIIMIHPVATFSYGITLLGALDDLNVGLTPNTVSFYVSASGSAFQSMFIAYVYNSIFWFAVTWYLNRIVKPEYGQAPEVWYFPITISYWKSFFHPRTNGNMKDGECATAAGSVDTNADELPPTEEVSELLRKQSLNGESIEIVNLQKEFGDKSAVNGLNLSMYNGHITALLGHNGAGKTTTINMLTGAIAPTSGTATVAGKDIRTQMPEIRRDIGICMQHDCLFPRLTVREHVEFFTRLKGFYDNLSKEEADEHVNQAIEDVALWEKRDTFSGNLSGGMKRKLSVAIAFCGGSKVVILDEPTSGMDPFSRRFTWNVIRHYRQNRIIILTTHFMDEADILGDRIAIMSDGKLRCVGSSLFLKKIFGSGYQLTIEKNQVIGHPPHGGVAPTICNNENIVHQDQYDEDSIEVIDEIKVDDSSRTLTIHSADYRSIKSFACSRHLKDIVTSFIPEAQMLSDVGSELSYQLPLGSSHLFTAMFQQLDEQIDTGNISCYGVSITTLDEVFMLVTRGAKKEKHTFASSRGGSSDVLSERATEISQSPLITLDENISFSRHLRTLLRKRAAIFRRDKKAWLFTTILPSMFVLFGFFLYNFLSFNLFWTPLPLRVSDYNKEFITAAVQNPIAVNSPENPFMCQIPTCSHKTPFVQEDLTNEKYFFCGFQSKLGISTEGYIPTNATCNISESLSIIDSLNYGGVAKVELDVTNVTDASEKLIESSKQYAATQYGAIWFTHEDESIMNDGQSYKEVVASQCEQIANSGRLNYSSADDCKHFGGLGYIIQYNFTLLHVAPLFQALADEAIVRHATNNQNFSLEATIAPLPITKREQQSAKAEDAFTVWFLVVMSFPFISGAFATFVVNERHSKAKHVQSIAGVEPSAYWLSTFIWDIVNYQIPLLITVILMFAFNVDVLTTTKKDIFAGVMTILALYGPASAGFTYCLTFGFQSSSLCNITIIISGFLIGMGGPLTCHVLYLRSIDPRGPQPSLADVANLLAWFLRWNPSFCLGNGIFNAIYIDTVAVIHKKDNLTAWDPDVLLTDVYCLVVHSFLFIVLAIQIDKLSTNPHTLALLQNCKDLSWVWRAGRPRQNLSIQKCLDEDVFAEQELVRSGKVCSDSIVIKNLTKVYGNGKVAVDNLSLGIAPGECFGLLGINGAGKTTTMGLLTAEFPPTSGDAILGGYSITREPQKIRRRIGYCPQFCAHFENMTGREHLEMYAAIKGISKDQVNEAVSRKLKEVGLSDYDSDRLSIHYSGGMKRRLSLACATIGQPNIVFLDECSTGVDPLTRRDIWQLVSDMVVGNYAPGTQQPAVILTTHSMEECEALCPRIGIMANGQLRCLGSAQHLKSKFGKGYQLEVKVQHVSRTDSDYQQNLNEVMKRYDLTGTEVTASIDDIDLTKLSRRELYFNLDEAKCALDLLSGDDSLSKMVEPTDPIGFFVWKEASSSPPGIPLSSLVLFATCELRMRQLEHFMNQSFPKNVLRERQDTKARYEVDCNGMKISSMFAYIEENKDILRLCDYSVSQTSLEQVFNMHAAEAEKCKLNQIDG